jgi:hypothetical protein
MFLINNTSYSIYPLNFLFLMVLKLENKKIFHLKNFDKKEI